MTKTFSGVDHIKASIALFVERNPGTTSVSITNSTNATDIAIATALEQLIAEGTIEKRGRHPSRFYLIGDRPPAQSEKILFCLPEEFSRRKVERFSDLPDSQRRRSVEVIRDSGGGTVPEMRKWAEVNGVELPVAFSSQVAAAADRYPFVKKKGTSGEYRYYFVEESND